MSGTKKIETRTISGRVEVRSANGERRLAGRAAVYNVLSSDLGGFRERLAVGAFRNALKRGDNCVLTLNHDVNAILARNKAGTLKLVEDSQGLMFDALLPETQTAKDAHTLVRDGLIDQCSFRFSMDDEDWSDEYDPEDGRSIKVRTVKDLHLYDCAIVASPAYPQGTSVGARSFDYRVPPMELVSPEERLEIWDREARRKLDQIGQEIAGEYQKEIDSWNADKKFPL